MVRIISFILKAPLWLFQKQRYQAFKLQKIDKIIISMDYLTIHQRDRKNGCKNGTNPFKSSSNSEQSDTDEMNQEKENEQGFCLTCLKRCF